MKNLKINLATGIVEIINCVLFAISWPMIFGAAVSDGFTGTHVTGGTGAFFYVMAGIGIVLNIVALIQSKKVGISLVGPILGIIGNALFLASAIMAFPAIVVLIIGVVFVFLHHPSKNGYAINNSSNIQNNSRQQNQYQPNNQQYGYNNQANQQQAQNYNNPQNNQNYGSTGTRMSRRSK
ncbi:transporter [Companilactobacillus jidongensis]|uniref:transporter n=1 Tax=Companilactobacillus jidongensis TaxID=2486006 RepID=UPI002989C1E7|nr:transporter [Companilactobacillus jidongensis]